MLDVKKISNSKFTTGFLAAFLLFSLSSCSILPTSSHVSTYEFITDQSKVLETGGFAGVHQTYPIKGNFKLYVNNKTNTASFEHVDATLMEPTGFLTTPNLEKLFNMNKLECTMSNSSTIVFSGKSPEDNSDVSITLTMTDDTVTLKGQTTPPPSTADLFVFNLDAVAKKK